MSKKVIDLSQDSDEEFEYFQSNRLSSFESVPSPLRWSPVFSDDQHINPEPGTDLFADSR